MKIKVIKFREDFVKPILSGEKNRTWRLFDDKELLKDDIVALVNSNTDEQFGTATLVDVWEKKMCELKDSDFEGHATYANEEEMYSAYRTYYGERVGPDTIVKVIRFNFHQLFSD